MMSEKTKDRGNKGQTQKDRPRMLVRTEMAGAFS